MTTIALFGAGGKMGVRLAKNLVGSAYEVRHVEPGAAQPRHHGSHPFLPDGERPLPVGHQSRGERVHEVPEDVDLPPLPG